MVTATSPGDIAVLTADEGREFLESWAQETLHVSLDEFIERWKSGAYGGVDDDPRALRLAMMLPIVGVDPWSDGSRT